MPSIACLHSLTSAVAEKAKRRAIMDGDLWALPQFLQDNLPVPCYTRWGYQWLSLPLSAEEYCYGLCGQWIQQAEHSPRGRGEEEELPKSSDQDALCSHPLPHSEVSCMYQKKRAFYVQWGADEMTVATENKPALTGRRPYPPAKEEPS